VGETGQDIVQYSVSICQRVHWQSLFSSEFDYRYTCYKNCM